MNKITCFFLGVGLSGALCFVFNFSLSSTVSGEKHDVQAGTSSGKLGNTGQAPEYQPPTKATSRLPSSLEKIASPVRVLEDLARTSPELIGRLNLRLFDENLNPILQNWALLGTDKSEIDALHAKLLEVSEKIRSEELKNFEVIEDSDDGVQLALQPISEEIAGQLSRQFEQAYASTFSPELAKALSSAFVSSPSPAVGALKRLNRIVTVRMTPDDLYQRTGKKYALDIRTLPENTKVADALKDLDTYSMSRTDLLLDEIPSTWAHLFKEE